MFLDEFDHIIKISIHALREEGDQKSATNHSRRILFLSTPSARRATCGPGRLRTPLGYFYPRPPRGGRHVGLKHPDQI